MVHPPKSSNFGSKSMIAPSTNLRYHESRRPEQVRVPRRAPEAHAANDYAFGDQVMQVRVLLRLVLPGLVDVFARLPRVVLVVARHVDHRRAPEFLLDERPGVHIRADVARKHQHIAVFDGKEIVEFRLVVRAHLQVQVGGDLNLHGGFPRGGAILQICDGVCTRKSGANGHN